MSVNKKFGNGYNRIIYDNSAIKVVIAAILIMLLSLSFFSVFTYSVVKNAVISKLKSRDLVYIAKSMSAKIDARINRAKETSLILARDPMVEKWIEDGEKDETIGKYVKQKITDISKDYDYSQTFLASAVTGHYWSENGHMLYTLSKKDTRDSWFFETLISRNRISLNINYDKGFKDTFVFINTLIGDLNDPAGITGVALNLNGISKEFKSYKFGKNSNLWLVDRNGKIHISGDIDQLGQNMAAFIPVRVMRTVLTANGRIPARHIVVEYTHKNGELYDLIAQPIHSTDWKLVFQIPRSESTLILAPIKTNTIAAGVVIAVLMIIILYVISNKIANPYKRAVQLSQELERIVTERTRELNEKTQELQDINTKIIDSIEYAELIQKSILPTAVELGRIFRDYFIIWRPRDMVGGDFYWMKRIKNTIVIAVGDCTGHGVPGALMTMVAYSILNQLVTETNAQNPALILEEFNRIFKATLNKKGTAKSIDDGLDIGICSVSDGNHLIYAGAKLALYIKNAGELKIIPGDRKGIGYANIHNDFLFGNTRYEIQPGDAFYLTTDGYVDQNGGAKDFSFGKKRFEQVIAALRETDFNLQKTAFEEELQKYMNGEPQRDDITVIGFRV